MNHRYGKSWSEDQKELRRQFNIENGIRPPDRTGIPHSETTKTKMSQSAKGKPKSDAHRKAMSVARKGLKLGPCPPERAKKIAEAQYHKYELVNPAGIKFYLHTGQLKIFLKFEKLNYGGLMAVKDKPKTYKGWTVSDLGRLYPK